MPARSAPAAGRAAQNWVEGTSAGWISSTRSARSPRAAATSAGASSGDGQGRAKLRDACSRRETMSASRAAMARVLLDRHGDPEALLGRDEVVVVVERG